MTTLTAAATGFGRLLRAEWSKLWSVRRWGLVMLAAVGVTVLVSLLGASSSSFQTKGADLPPVGPQGAQVEDAFRFVHQPMTGDGEVVARVLDQSAAQGPGRPWAKAGIMVKDGTRPGSGYAAMLRTPGHGVRWQTNFVVDRPGSDAATSPWLRLTRTGDTVTGYESTDGVTWRQVGTAVLTGLPDTAEVGLFVASPRVDRIERQFSSSSITSLPTWSTARFDNIRVRPAGAPPSAGWADELVGTTAPGDPGGTGGPVPPPTPDRPDGPPVPEAALLSGLPDPATGISTVTGSGDVAPRAMDEDLTRMSLSGALIGLLPLIGLAVLFIAAEYRRGMIRTTFAASPGRGRVVLAKSVVIGAATFGVGLVACVVAFLASRPFQRENGYVPPLFPSPSLTDWPVSRAILGTAAVLALVAVLSLGLGTILRRAAAAITVVIAVMVLPQMLAGALPLTAARWLMRLTPAAGFSVQQTNPRYDHVDVVCLPEAGCSPDGPWLGVAVLCGYVLLVVAVACWLVRRRDA
ncbi:DUF1349 domain-containing protein [Plantactinospora sonchi]|uniref:DUF1349 domain-containing protein n=1 Tax=Plantactinospora sonchi TaxID=1544735 RepID=A0ABU7S222_9ACTN